jgi:2,5-diamino-6-(ribosylamino)-4(3H)-pyrimidinone 5'-phosphate reductase
MLVGWGMGMLPRVVIHNEMSVDGRVEWLDVHMGLYYELAGRWKEDATLVGADTILAAPDEIPEETEDDLGPVEVDGDRPLLVIPDSRGRVRTWHALRSWPFWGRFVALVSSTTPEEYIGYLEARGIEHITAGEDHVDMREALEELADRYSVKLVRTDSGGTLNGVLLAEGLADEVSVMVNASLVGGSATHFFRSPEPWTKEDKIGLRLTHVEELDDGVVWLRYDVVK